MSEPSSEPTDGSVDGHDKRGGARRAKTIRLSNSEWELVDNAAMERRILAAEVVRAAAVDAAEGKFAALTAEIVASIRRMYRSTHILPTLKRDEMLREGGRDGATEKTIQAARESQGSLRKQGSE